MSPEEYARKSPSGVDGSPLYEVVDHSEVGIGDEPPKERQETETHYADGTQKLDEFGAPIRKVVRVRDGVVDRPARPPR